VTGRTLDREQRLSLRPDLVVWKGGRCHTVLDAKFKRLDQDLGGDAYQLLAYLLEFGPPRGFLISAEGETSDHAVRAVEKQISARPVNLDQEPQVVLRAIDALAVEVLQ
jgi:5-methylcytosine-specific restriction endonuclease McrBC regulatory subunit McrC